MYYSLIQSNTEEYPNTTYDNLHESTLKSIFENVNIDVQSLNDEEMVFDMIGIEPPLANALRRILLSEIPTMAIEVVNIYQNTSIIPDEVLSHRLGLIPLLAEANDFQYKKTNDEFNEHNSFNFKLHIKCERNKNKKDPSESDVLNNEVYSYSLVFTPIGNQAKLFGSSIPKPVHDDILIAKLRPGQVL
jgi:DNA-directed RNA polymerase I and III subunit RPAC1